MSFNIHALLLNPLCFVGVREMKMSQQQEKIIKMKLQTAKILWAEDRKEATFLLLESIDDPRADDLRDRMGFDDDFEVKGTQQQSIPLVSIGIGAVVLVVLSFLLGTFLDLNGASDASANQMIAEDEIINTIIAPTPQPDEPLSQPLLEMTSTASQIQQTQLAIENNQNTSMSFLDATETARYMQATATEHTRETQSASN